VVAVVLHGLMALQLQVAQAEAVMEITILAGLQLHQVLQTMVVAVAVVKDKTAHLL
jgi:hypothetical protein